MAANAAGLCANLPNHVDDLSVAVLDDTDDAHNLAVRLQHFSNAGISHPNPGEKFLQLRYSLHTDRTSCEE